MVITFYKTAYGLLRAIGLDLGAALVAKAYDDINHGCDEGRSEVSKGQGDDASQVEKHDDETNKRACKSTLSGTAQAQMKA